MYDRRCFGYYSAKQLEEERLQALQQAEEKERQRAEEAERYRKQQEEFIDTVCHEIRNPMSGIYSTVDFLEETMASLKTLKENLPASLQPALEESLQKLKENTKTIEQCVKHQKTIIDDVLNLSKLESGKVELVLKPFQPQTVIEEVTRLFTPQLVAKQLELNLVLPKQAIAIKGDPERFKIVLINLISNAVKFTEKGHITISLQTQAVDPTHVKLIIRVKDTGIGMTPEQHSRLFQRFSRPLSSQYEGSGLGLAISKKLLDLMGDDIQVDSVEGQGSTFTIHLTCETVGLEEKISPLIYQKPPAPAPILSPGSKHILVVEDNKVNQTILRKQLEAAGYTCTVADNGQKALEAIGALDEIKTREQWNQKQFDLILMDMEMPVMGGLVATKRIREKENKLKVARIPIVGLSAYAREVYSEQATEAGMDAYLTKPYVKAELHQTIQSLISRFPRPTLEQPVSLETRIPSVIEKVPLRPKTPPSTPVPSPFWSPLPTAAQVPRTWMPALLRNALYPALDALSAELHSLGITRVIPPSQYQDKSSTTGWQLYAITEQDEYWAVLNLAQEADVDNMMVAIHKSDAQLSAKKMLSGTTPAVVITFSSQTRLGSEINKIKTHLQNQSTLRLTPS